jgi:hypothetical protein
VLLSERASEWQLDQVFKFATKALGDVSPEVSQYPIPVHRLQPGAGATGWASSLPLVALLFPVFVDSRLACAVTLRPDGSSSLSHVGHDSPFAASLKISIDIARLPSDPEASLRMVETPGLPDAFWIGWGHDTFVLAEDGRVVSGPEYAEMARRAAATSGAIPMTDEDLLQTE